MKQITEDYVSFETAKLLKKKGFNIPCRFNYRSIYSNNPKPFYHKSLKDFNGEEYEGLSSEWFSAPSQSLALKWLREVHNTHISVEMGFDVDNPQCFFYIPSICKFSNKTGEYNTPFGEEEFDTYESVCEAALLYVLKNLI